MYPAARHYSPDPLEDEAASLTPQQKARILGGEACMWAEFMSAANIDNRIWPRAAAVAERLWSPQDVKDPDEMYRRLEILSKYLDAVGVAHNAYYRQTLRRLAGGKDVPALQILTDVLEPVKGYTRERTHEYENATPLDRLVDALHPESDAARHFSGMVDGFLKNPAGNDATVLQNQLTLWRDNDRALAPVFQSNARLQEVVPLSQNLAAVSVAGLQALDYLKAGGRAPAVWRDSQLNLLKQAEKPQGEMLNMIVPSVRKLVEATTPK
jgi:hexosaminidase